KWSKKGHAKVLAHRSEPEPGKEEADSRPQHERENEEHWGHHGEVPKADTQQDPGLPNSLCKIAQGHSDTPAKSKDRQDHDGQDNDLALRRIKAEDNLSGKDHGDYSHGRDQNHGVPDGPEPGRSHPRQIIPNFREGGKEDRTEHAPDVGRDQMGK